MTAWDNLFPVVSACAVKLLGGVVLHAQADEGVVTAGNGKVVDWRENKSGETVATGIDAFETAHLFVELVGPEAAERAVREWAVRVGDAPPQIGPRVTAFAINPCGGRRRAFKVGRFTVMVEPHEDDEGQAEFTERLAAAAARMEEEGT